MKTEQFIRTLVALAVFAGLFAGLMSDASACTGVRLTAKDGSIVYGRTMEWGAFDLRSRVSIIPRRYTFQGLTPDGYNGKKWSAKYGVLSLDMLERDNIVVGDGMNEKGLAVGLFYLPGFAEYMSYEKDLADNTITAVDVAGYLLTQCATIEDVKAVIERVRVVAVVDEAIGAPVQCHWLVTEASGKSIVIEYLNGKLRVFDAPLGVLTNSPSYDWHLINLRNYVNLSAVAIPSKKIDELDFAPLGGGSGMIGLPGDFTPPSRFIRAVAWSKTTRPLANATEAVYELFRILDNFNVPLGAAEGSDSHATDSPEMRSSTLWTTAWDLSGRVFYFHTQHNRRVRRIDLNQLDFSGKTIRYIKMDENRQQDILDITPSVR